MRFLLQRLEDLCFNFLKRKKLLFVEESTNLIQNFISLIDPTHVDERIILRWIFRKLEGVVGTGWSWLRIGKGGGHLWVR
jgi:hypothetical protein